MKYIYPKLPAAYTTPFFRIGGNGLANCLFVYAKAIVLAHSTNAQILSPTWFNLSIGTYLRKQKDKRHYCGIFNTKDEIHGLKRFFLLVKKSLLKDRSGVTEVSGIYDFFVPLIEHHNIVRNHILSHINSDLLREVNAYDFKNSVAVHVRLGDFPGSRRIPLEWYVQRIIEHPNKRILLFSDGADDELKPLLELDNVQRVYFGGAIQDIIAISKCEYLIGSDSSFSAWGAYLGQVPSHFLRLQFGNVLMKDNDQIIEER